MTRSQSNNQCRGDIAANPAPKNSECKNPLKNFSPRFFLDEDGIVLIDYLPKGQTMNAEYYSSLLLQLKDILKEKAAGRSPKGSCSCTSMTRLTGHLQPRRNWPTWASSVLNIHPILRSGPSDYHLFSGLKKTIEISPFFVRRGGHCCRGELVGRTTF